MFFSKTHWLKCRPDGTVILSLECRKLFIYGNTHTHTRLTALFPGLPGWASTRKVKTNLDFTEARDSELQWYQLGHMQICTSLQTDNHASTPPLSFLQAGCPSCRPTNSVKALKGLYYLFIYGNLKWYLWCPLPGVILCYVSPWAIRF